MSIEHHKKDLSSDTITFGKYKNKKLEDIYKLDKTYIMWLQKNNKYLNETNKQIVDELLK